MAKYMVWIALEDAAPNKEMMEAILRSHLEHIKEKEFIKGYGIVVRELKEGELPSARPPEELLPKVGKA